MNSTIGVNEIVTPTKPLTNCRHNEIAKAVTQVMSRRACVYEYLIQLMQDCKASVSNESAAAGNVAP